jgi:translation initiation factor eIF-2B subunit alpha
LSKGTVEEIKGAVIAAIEDEIKHLHRNIQRVVDIGVECIEDGDFIIVYSVNAPVKRIIPEAKKRGKNFKVLIVRQDIRKTQQVMKILDKEGVEYIVVPEYGLSHFLDKADKLFLGAIAVTEDGKAVTAAGTSNIISIAHIHKLPVFLFVNSLKFSVKKSMEQNIHQKIEKRSHDDFEYTLISHSHDLVDLDLIDHLVIEEGEIEKKDILKYRSKLGL